MITFTEHCFISRTVREELGMITFTEHCFISRTVREELGMITFTLALRPQRPYGLLGRSWA